MVMMCCRALGLVVWQGPVSGRFPLLCVKARVDTCMIQIFFFIEYRFDLPGHICHLIKSSIEYPVPGTSGLLG